MQVIIRDVFKIDIVGMTRRNCEKGNKDIKGNSLA